jgi:hypothetical protein
MTPFGCNHETAINSGTARNVDNGAIVAPLYAGLCRGQYPQRRERVQPRIERYPKAPRLHHVAERGSAGLAMVEMQMQPGGSPTKPAIADANLEDRARRLSQAVPDPGLYQKPTGASGDCVGAAVERWVRHWRQCSAIHHDGSDACGRQAAGEHTANGARTDNAYIRR